MRNNIRLKEKQWSEIKVASGSAEFVPGAIEGLTSPDDAVRHDARFMLDNQVVLQSDLYEAAPYTIPLLLKLLDSNPVHGRAEIYMVLIEIAAGYAPPDVKVASQSGAELTLPDACASQLSVGRDVFTKDVDDKSVGHLALELLEAMDQEKLSQ